MATKSVHQSVEPDRIALNARDVEFDFHELPLHWIPNEPVATHMINVMHMMLPEFEEWFVRCFSEALPYIKDEQLKEDVLGFIGQEAQHAKGHADALERLKAQGLDPGPFAEQMAWLVKLLYSNRGLSGRARYELMVLQASLTSAIEHITAFLGQWVLNAKSLDAAGADPVMLDLLRWHGAEEVEHRSVAYDLYQHLDGGYVRRVVPYGLVLPALVWVWIIVGTRYLLKNDPVVQGNASLDPLTFWRASRKGILPTVWEIVKMAPGYLMPKYHPSKYGSTSQAVAYLANSPAARSAIDRQYLQASAR
ncbi:metal-dependent hydrolase [Smaragdicoccus niigatensis]|uniref:metal-dependent hydrolase n=1 Tax=Smaragdicoccus niigatensis TaxID=359359 RepID=UPI00037F036C|nr:metal-dependent hydrolase [Smaragdicoccus niigatensis]